MAFKRKSEEKILDVDASMQGTLSFKDPVNLRINGKFEGTLETKGNLTVGQTAQVFADITGDNIVIGGRVRGRLTAKERLTLLPTAIVEGDIYPAKLNVAEGAILEGNCSMLHDFLNAEELARYLEVDLNSVLEWANSGKIPGLKESGDWRFERKSIDSWVASGRVGKWLETRAQKPDKNLVTVICYLVTPEWNEGRMAEEKLLTVRDVSIILGISEKEVIDLAEGGQMPAYKVGGIFLRFKREQIDEFRKTFRPAISFQEKNHENYSLKEKISDFFYFNDFYILSVLIILLMLAIIFRGY